MAVATATALSLIKGNQANKEAAAAQGRIAQEQLATAEKAASFAAPTAEELKTLNQQIAVYDRAYAASTAQLDTLQEEITKTYGQNIIQLGEQLHNELLGAESAITRQTNDQIARQRKAREQQIIDRLGPGGLTSSAGIQAMAAFDREAAVTMAQTRENALNGTIQRLGGLQGAQGNAVSSALNIGQSLSGMLNSIQGTQNVFQSRQMNAWNNVAQFAGANEVEGLQRARADASTWNTVANIGTQLAGTAIGAAIGNPTAGSGGGGNKQVQPFEAPTLASTNFNSQSTGWNSPTPLTGGNLQFQSWGS
jgi:hypothetical protein